MNNKGFAVTTVVYAILILLTMFIFVILNVYKNEYSNQKQFTNDVKEELNKDLGKHNVKNNLDTSGANVPELVNGMIPVYYDGTNWRKADAKNENSAYQWYSYENSGTKKGMWANAVTVTSTNRATITAAPVGTPISMTDINTMWVWIPRYSYTIKSENGTNYYGNGGTTTTSPGSIDIKFVNTSTAETGTAKYTGTSATNYYTHPAFIFNGNKAGMWVGKFENSSNISCTGAGFSAKGSGCNLSTIVPLIKPNVVTWYGMQISTVYSNIKTYMNSTNGNTNYGLNDSYDAHLIKNSEWGAISYLTQSIYGRCTSKTSCVNVSPNNSTTYLTGGGNYISNVSQSTTGNIYGIYDMAGGGKEAVMGNYNNIVGASSSNTSGFAGKLSEGGTATGVAFPTSQYINIYSTTTISNVCCGDALSETKSWYGASIQEFVYTWLYRGGLANDTYTNPNIFSFSSGIGNSWVGDSSRTVIIK